MEANVQPMYSLEFKKGFSDYEYDGESLFYLLFQKIPSNWKIGDVDSKLLDKWLANGEVQVLQNHQSNFYRQAARSKRYCMSQVYVLNNQMILELKQHSLSLIFDHALGVASTKKIITLSSGNRQYLDRHRSMLV